MPRIIVVKGPFVLFSQSTSVVAAGAVAAEMEPIRSPSEIAKDQFLKKNHPAAVISIETTTKAPKDSIKSMVVNCFPYFLMVFIFNSPPIINPINPKAKVLKGCR